MDCDKKSNGCNGGLYTLAWEYLETQGMYMEADYPYISGDGTKEACKFKPTSPARMKVKSYATVTSNSPD